MAIGVPAFYNDITLPIACSFSLTRSSGRTVRLWGESLVAFDMHHYAIADLEECPVQIAIYAMPKHPPPAVNV
jgi:hypothetical protein